jgi:hypothetical protein
MVCTEEDLRRLVLRHHGIAIEALSMAQRDAGIRNCEFEMQTHAGNTRLATLYQTILAVIHRTDTTAKDMIRSAVAAIQHEFGIPVELTSTT